MTLKYQLTAEQKSKTKQSIKDYYERNREQEQKYVAMPHKMRSQCLHIKCCTVIISTPEKGKLRYHKD